MRGSRRRLQVGAALRGAWGDSLVRNSAQLLLTTAGTSGLGYLYWVLAARLLPREAVGLGSALISAMGVCALLADLGLSSTCIQRLPHRRSGQEWNLTVSTSVVLSAGTGAGAGLLACALLPALSSSFRVLLDSPLALVLFVVGTAMSAAGNLVDHVFVAERASGGMTSRNLCFSLGKLLLLAVPVGAATAIHPLFASWIGSLAIALPLALVVLLPRLRPGVRPVLAGFVRETRLGLRSMAGHHVTNIGGMVPAFVLPVLVVVRLSPTENAYFYLTWMVGTVFFMVSPAVCASLFAEGSHDKGSFARQIRRSAVIISALLAGPLLACVLFGHLVLRLFGPEFPDHAYWLLLALAFSSVPDGVTNIGIAVLRVQRRLGLAALLNNGMAVVALVGAWELLPPLGIAGAGLAWLVAQTLGAAAVLVGLVRGRRSRQGAAPVALGSPGRS